MKFPSIIEYLTSSGVLDTGSSEDIAAAKKERRRQYLTAKKREYRKTHKSVTLSFPNSEMRALQKEAAEHKMKVPAYLRACIEVAREQAYILPNTDAVHQIELLLRRISTNTNQIARLANSMSMPPVRAIKEIREHLVFFEETFTKMFREPKNLEQVIREEIKNNPVFAQTLLRIIEDHMKSLVDVH